MCNCNSRWVNLAKQLISSNNISCEEKAVLEYLLTNNHCGINKGAKIDDVLIYVNKNCSLQYSRENFQHQVLIPLKQKGVITTLIYPGPTKGGLFIPCNTNEIKQVYRQVLERILSELNNIAYTVSSSDINQNIRILITQIQNEINKL